MPLFHPPSPGSTTEGTVGAVQCRYLAIGVGNGFNKRPHGFSKRFHVSLYLLGSRPFAPSRWLPHALLCALITRDRHHLLPSGLAAAGLDWDLGFGAQKSAHGRCDCSFHSAADATTVDPATGPERGPDPPSVFFRIGDGPGSGAGETIEKLKRHRLPYLSDRARRSKISSKEG